MNEELTGIENHVRQVRDLLELPLPEDSVELIETLTKAHAQITAALDEAMAGAALEGLSLRSIASSAGVAPNSVPPRLARSQTLSSYAHEGKVTAEGVVVARSDQQRLVHPTFIPRKRTKRVD